MYIYIYVYMYRYIHIYIYTYLPQLGFRVALFFRKSGSFDDTTIDKFGAWGQNLTLVSG